MLGDVIVAVQVVGVVMTGFKAIGAFGIGSVPSMDSCLSEIPSPSVSKSGKVILDVQVIVNAMSGVDATETIFKYKSPLSKT